MLRDILSFSLLLFLPEITLDPDPDSLNPATNPFLDGGHVSFYSYFSHVVLLLFRLLPLGLLSTMTLYSD